MPPTFKKPLQYDPALAEETLKKTYSQSDYAKQERKKSMLAELGLGDGDEEYEVDDDIEEGDEDADLDDDEQPYLRNGNNAKHANGQSALPTYGYQDLFGKDHERRRRQMIQVKGYDRFVTDLLERSQTSLQALRGESGLQYPGNVEIIPDLLQEVRFLFDEYKQLEQQASNGEGAAPRPGSLRSMAIGEENTIGDLRAKIDDLKKQLSQRDTKLAVAERELETAHRRIAALSNQHGTRDAHLRSVANDGVAASSEAAAQIEHLKTTLALKESQLATALARADALNLAAGEGAAASHGIAEELASLRKARDDAQATAELARQQALQLKSEMAAQEDSFNKRLHEIMHSSETDQTQAVQKQLWALTEQHSKKVEEMEAELKQKQVLIQQLQSTKSEALSAMQDMKVKVAGAHTSAASAMKGKLQAINSSLQELHTLREGVLAELVAMQTEMYSEKAITTMARLVRDKEITSIRKAQSDLKAKLTTAEAQIQESKDEAEATRHRAEEAARILRLEAQGQIEHFQEKWRGEFEKRRKLHNLVLELKGNIRVLARIRPMLEKERFNAGDESAMPVRCLSEELVRVNAVDNKAEREWEFDRVLAPVDGQNKVYDEVAPLVISVLDGYNVTILAYGQTGSGKTYTMEGPESDPGVNLRALGELFRLAAERSTDVAYSFSASVLEIYNENIYDLLVNSSGPGKDDDKLDVKQGAEGMYVQGLRIEEVNDMNEVGALINRGKSNRSTYATNMNEHSSRSHLVLSVYVVGTNKATGVTLRGKLHLIDLAGSERLSRTGAQGDRLKEAQAINKSLSALGDVIQALQQRNAHIPYRNSKLTRLLEDSLGGNSKCVMIVNVSPAVENVSETKCSLEFASRARKVELGRAKANVSTNAQQAADPANGGVSPLRSGARTPTEAISRSTSKDALSGAAAASARKSNLSAR